MTPTTAIDIEFVVREVVRRLRRIERAMESPAAERDGVLVVSERVVALGIVEGKLKGVKRLVVPRGAVITPAARDELKARHIAVEIVAAGEKPSAPAVKLIVAVCGLRMRAQALAKGIGGVQPADALAESDLQSLIEKLEMAISTQHKTAILATDQPAAALLLANRKSGLRATFARTEKEVEENTAAIGANLLVVDPRGRSEFEISGLARRFAAVGKSSGLRGLETG